MTKAVPNSDICVIKAVLLLYEHANFSLNFASFGLSCPPPPQYCQGQIGLVLEGDALDFAPLIEVLKLEAQKVTELGIKYDKKKCFRRVFLFYI